MTRSPQTRSIETMLKKGKSISSIAREFGVSRQRVQTVNKRLMGDYESVLAPPKPASSIKTLTINLTPAVLAAVVEACAVVNRKSEEPITIVEYIEELVIAQVVEMGLLRKNKRR